MLADASFQMGSLLHVGTVLACVALIAAAAVLGRRLRAVRPSVEFRLRIAWIAGVVALQLGSQVWQNIPGNFDLRYTVPLHVCDLAVWAAPFALLGRSRWARLILFFWGLGLSSFAFVLPILREGPSHIAYWLFWAGHVQILGSAVYLVAVHDYRPDGKDVRSALLATIVYVAIVFAFDVAFGVDYGNVGPDPSASAMLGGWPLRVVVLVALEASLYTLMWLTFRRDGRVG
jgi:hypothetical integral membrane protein (TIGR02206 family)